MSVAIDPTYELVTISLSVARGSMSPPYDGWQWGMDLFTNKVTAAVASV